jgi:hypothetical protein
MLTNDKIQKAETPVAAANARRPRDGTMGAAPSEEIGELAVLVEQLGAQAHKLDALADILLAQGDEGTTVGLEEKSKAADLLAIARYADQELSGALNDRRSGMRNAVAGLVSLLRPQVCAALTQVNAEVGHAEHAVAATEQHTVTSHIVAAVRQEKSQERKETAVARKPDPPRPHSVVFLPKPSLPELPALPASAPMLPYLQPIYWVSPVSGPAAGAVQNMLQLPAARDAMAQLMGPRAPETACRLEPPPSIINTIPEGLRLAIADTTSAAHTAIVTVKDDAIAVGDAVLDPVGTARKAASAVVQATGSRITYVEDVAAATLNRARAAEHAVEASFAHNLATAKQKAFHLAQVLHLASPDAAPIAVAQQDAPRAAGGASPSAPMLSASAAPPSMARALAATQIADLQLPPLTGMGEWGMLPDDFGMPAFAMAVPGWGMSTGVS